MNTNERLTAIETTLAALVAHLGIDEPAKVTAPKRASKPSQPKAATTKALTKATRKAFVAAALKDGYDFEGYSTWEVAYHAVSIDYAPKGFHVGERYTEMALEAGA